MSVTKEQTRETDISIPYLTLGLWTISSPITVCSSEDMRKKMLGKNILRFLTITIITITLLSVSLIPSGDGVNISVLNVKTQRSYIYEYEKMELLQASLDHLNYESHDVELIIMPGVFSFAPINCFSDPDIDFLKEYDNPYWTDVFWKGVNDYDVIRSCLSELPNEGICFRGVYVPKEEFMHTPDGWDNEIAEEAGYIISREGSIITRDQPEKDLFVFHLEEGDFGVYFRENAKYELPEWYIRLKELYYGIDIVEASSLLSKKTFPTVYDTQEICLKAINTHRPYLWSVFAAMGLVLILSVASVHNSLFLTIYKKRKDLLCLLVAISMTILIIGVVASVIEKMERIHSTGEGPIGYWENIDISDKTGSTLSWELSNDESFELKTQEKNYYGIWKTNADHTISLIFTNENEKYEQRWLYRTKEVKNGRLLNVYNPFGNVILRFRSKGKIVETEKEKSSSANIYVNIIYDDEGSTETTVVDLRESGTAWISLIKGSELYMQSPVTLPVPGRDGEMKINFDGQTFTVDVFEDTLSIHGESLDVNIYAFDYRYFEDSLLESVYQYVVDCEPGENIKVAPVYSTEN